MKIIYKHIDEINPYDNNPRDNRKAIAPVVESIRQFGFRVPIIIDEQNTIIAGHTRYEACKELGITDIPTITADGLTDEQIKAFRVVDNKTNEIKTVVISVCHDEDFTDEHIKQYVIQMLINNNLYYSGVKYLINTAGRWTIGRAIADAGLTGRKIVADQYGGFAPVGGGAFSGKDPTKVDRSATYMARYIAKHLVKKYSLEYAEVQLAYAIGQAQPVSISVKTNNGKDYTKYVKENFNLTPKGIIDKLNLLETNYEKVAEGCHFYNDELWEK